MQFEALVVKPMQQVLKKGVVTGVALGVGELIIVGGIGLAYYVGGQLVLVGSATFSQVAAGLQRYAWPLVRAHDALTHHDSSRHR